MNQNWIVELERQDYFNRNHLLLVANGYIGARASFGEMFSIENSSTHIIGIYDQVGYDDPDKDPWHPERDKWKEIINIPNFLLTNLSFEGEKIKLKDNNLDDFHVWLDMKTATVHMEYVWT